MAWQIGQYYKEKGQELLEGGQGEVDEFRETYLDEDTAWNQNLGQKAWYPVQKLGEAQDFVNEQVNLRNTLQISKSLTDRIPGQWDERILDYSYKDLRDHTAGGIGNVAKFVTGSERAGQIGELAGQILLPDAIDFATGGVGYIDNLARGANVLRKSKFVSKGWKNGDELLKAFKQGGDHAHVAFNKAREHIAARGRGLQQLATTLSVTDVGPGIQTAASKVKKAKVFKEPSRTAIERADKMMDEGWALPEALLENYKNLKADDLTHLYKKAKKVYTDYDEYREAIAKYGSSKGIVENVGVLKIGSDIKLGKQRGGPNISIRGTVEDINTKLNRQLSELPQTKGGKVTFNQDSKIIKTLKKHYDVSQIDKHHGEALNQLEFLYRDASAADQKALTNFIVDDLKRPIGSTLENRMNIPKTEVHDPFHKLLREEAIGLEKTKDPTNIMPDLLRVANKQQAQKGLPPFKNLKHLTLEQRIGAAKVWFEHIAPHNHEVLFDLMQKMNKKRLSK